MEVSYNLIYQEHVIKKHIPALSSSTKELIKDAIEQKLMIILYTLENY